MLHRQHGPAQAEAHQLRHGWSDAARAKSIAHARVIASAGLPPSQYASWRPPKPQLSSADEQTLVDDRLIYEKQCLATQYEDMARRLRRRTLALGAGLVLTTGLAVAGAVAYLRPSLSPLEQTAAAAPPFSRPERLVEPARTTMVRVQPGTAPTDAGSIIPPVDRTSVVAAPTASPSPEPKPLIEPAQATAVQIEPATASILTGPTTPLVDRTPVMAAPAAPRVEPVIEAVPRRGREYPARHRATGSWSACAAGRACVGGGRAGGQHGKRERFPGAGAGHPSQRRAAGPGAAGDAHRHQAPDERTPTDRHRRGGRRSDCPPGIARAAAPESRPFAMRHCRPCDEPPVRGPPLHAAALRELRWFLAPSVTPAYGRV